MYMQFSSVQFSSVALFNFNTYLNFKQSKIHNLSYNFAQFCLFYFAKPHKFINKRGVFMKGRPLKIALFSLALFFTFPAFGQEQGSFTDDRDGTTYKTVKIGRETWMAENMKYIADEISCKTDSKHGSSVKNYGCLYSWADAQKVCPIGWHLPSRVELGRLLIQVGEGAEGSAALRDSAFKEGQNGSGFSALPAGTYSQGSYFEFGQSAYFWSATECDAEGANAYAMFLNYDKVSAQHCHNQITDALSVRCVKDTAGSNKQSTFNDPRDGNTYRTAQIGGRIWLAENMKYISDDIDYKATNKPNEYGILYNWSAAQKVCPAGWHLPSKVDFDRLLIQVGKGEKGSDNLRHKRWEKGKDLSGFSALPAGSCDKDGCAFFDTEAYFWSASERGKNQAYGLYVNISNVTVNSGKMESYLAVRCIKDALEAERAEPPAVAKTDIAAPNQEKAAPIPPKGKKAAEEKEGKAKTKSAPKPQTGNKRYLIGAVATGVAGGGGGIISGAVLMALAAGKARTNQRMSGNIDSVRKGTLELKDVPSQLELADVAQKGRAMEIGSYVSFGIAGAAVITAAVLGAKYHKSKKNNKNKFVTFAPTIDEQTAMFLIGGQW